jgi:hypothetical protein
MQNKPSKLSIVTYSSVSSPRGGGGGGGDEDICRSSSKYRDIMATDYSNYLYLIFDLAVRENDKRTDRKTLENIFKTMKLVLLQ